MIFITLHKTTVCYCGFMKISKASFAHRIWMMMTYVISMRSEDPSTHTGCVIVSSDGSDITIGYNGLPRNVSETPEKLSKENSEKYFWFEHAERNAIYNAVRNRKSLFGHSLYITWVPCMDCARAIVQCGISHVYIHKTGQDAYNNGKSNAWSESQKRSIELFKEVGIEVEFLEFPLPEIEIKLNGKNYNRLFDEVKYYV